MRNKFHGFSADSVPGEGEVFTKASEQLAFRFLRGAIEYLYIIMNSGQLLGKRSTFAGAQDVVWKTPSNYT